MSKPEGSTQSKWYKCLSLLAISSQLNFSLSNNNMIKFGDKLSQYKLYFIMNLLYKQQYTHTHTHKPKLTTAVTQLLPSSVPTLARCLVLLLRHSSLVWQSLLGARLVTRRRTVQVSQIEAAEPTVPQWPRWDYDSWAFASPGTHWHYSWVGCNFTSPHQLGNVSKLFCSRKQ